MEISSEEQTMFHAANVAQTRRCDETRRRKRHMDVTEMSTQTSTQAGGTDDEYFRNTQIVIIVSLASIVLLRTFMDMFHLLFNSASPRTRNNNLALKLCSLICQCMVLCILFVVYGRPTISALIEIRHKILHKGFTVIIALLLLVLLLELIELLI